MFLDDPKRIVLVGDWNAIFDSKIDWARRDGRGLDRCESSLIESSLIDFVDLGHPGRETWTWIDSSPSVRVWSYLDNARRADSDFVSCPTFHWIGQTDDKLVRVILRLENRPVL